ncbi:hypothetical protein HOY80DRAFT_958713 [Tuber brumale]|nr:hypothetical protein HOY80DRAFT_958713 [Tuber brumale]
MAKRTATMSMPSSIMVSNIQACKLALADSGVDYKKVVWGLLCECAAQVGWSHGGGGVFAGVVSRKREEVRRDLEKEQWRGWVGVMLEDISLGAEVGKIVGMVEGLVKELQR